MPGVRALFPLIFVLSCGTNPVNAVIPSGDSALDAGCTAQVDGYVRLISRVTGTCLGRGGPTTVFGMPAYETALLSDCSSPDALWQLIPYSTPGVSFLRHVSTAYNLDVRIAQTTAGTPLILYSPTQLSNQRFLVRMRAEPFVDLEPQNAAQMCVQTVAGAIQIWPCSTQVTPQEWIIQPQACP